MTRDEMESYIIEYYAILWSEGLDILEDMIAGGWPGVQSFTDEEIEETFIDLSPSIFEKDVAEKIRVEQKRLAVYNDNKPK